MIKYWLIIFNIQLFFVFLIKAIIMKTIFTLILIIMCKFTLSQEYIILNYSPSEDEVITIQYSCDGIYWYNYKTISVSKTKCLKINLIENDTIKNAELRIIKNN